MYRNRIDLDINGNKLELLAGETIYPGMLLIRWPETGLFEKWVAKHWFINGATSVLIALEKNNSVNEPYFEYDIMPAAFCLSGDRFLGIVEYETDLKYGDYLTSAGNGFLHIAPAEALYTMATVGMVCGEPEPFISSTTKLNLNPQLEYAWIPIEAR